MPLSVSNAVKKNIFFLLDDVLIPGSVNKKAGGTKAKTVLSFLSGLEKNGVIQIFLISGRTQALTEKIVAEHGLADFFQQGNIFSVDKSYLGAKSEIDKQRYDASLKADPRFEDEYFKQHVINSLLAAKKIAKDDSVLVCHDLTVDAFYTLRYSGIGFVFVKGSVSERHVKFDESLMKLNYIKFSKADFTKLIKGKFPEQDTKLLESFILNRLGRELMANTDFSGLIKKAVERQTANPPVPSNPSAPSNIPNGS